MIELTVFILLTAFAAFALAAALVLSLCLLAAVLRKKSNARLARRARKAAAFFAAALIVNGGIAAFSEAFAHTPKIPDQASNELKNSISELTRVELNGRKQWISIRGLDESKPVLLFLAGGPGGSQLAAQRHELKELEKHFVVVGWDQPGAAKSYYAENLGKITPETYIEDGLALTEYLKARFSKEKIYLIGESWGSALGIFLISKSPENYHAFIGAAQMVDFAETERMDYAKALEIAREKSDAKMLQALEKNGLPPYYGKDVTLKTAVYLNYLSAYMANNPEITNPGYNTLRDIGSPEYGIVDKINYVRGVLNTYNQVYQQLYAVDLREDYARLEVPVFFFLGRHDLNAPASLAEEYMAVLEAPRKEIVWFEHSGHSPWINERDKFVEEVLARFGAPEEE